MAALLPARSTARRDTEIADQGLIADAVDTPIFAEIAKPAASNSKPRLVEASMTVSLLMEIVEFAATKHVHSANDPTDAWVLSPTEFGASEPRARVAGSEGCAAYMFPAHQPGVADEAKPEPDQSLIKAPHHVHAWAETLKSGNQIKDIARVRRNFRKLNGAPEGTNLEPSECVGLLSELESWSEVLKAEPDVIHRLAVLRDGEDYVLEQSDDPQSDPLVWEPSP